MSSHCELIALWTCSLADYSGQAICRYFGEAVDENDKAAYCDNMCDVRFPRYSLALYNVPIILQICRYPAKAKARISRLSSDEAALTNVPFQRTESTTSVAGSSSHNGMPTDWQNRQQQRPLQARAPFGAQKRGPSAEDGEAPTKKSKTVYMPKLGSLWTAIYLL